MDQQRNWQRVKDQDFDVLIVGGGITGAGIARHAALSGLSTALVDAGDFASGTSSRSSKLIHGGLRYLAMGDIALVREAARERKSVNLMVPHLAQPRWMVVPARSYLELMKLRAGIGLYERLGEVHRDHRHRNWHGRELTRHEPLLKRSRNPHACVYREYLTDDVRLVLATLGDAQAHGATVANYLKVTALRQTDGYAIATVCDGVTGEVFELKARVLVNAAGPWVESLLPDRPQPRLHLSKGVHLVFDRERLPVNNLLMLTAADRRPVFVIPRTTTTYVGTTDTSYPNADYWPEIDERDVHYLLETINDQLDVAPVSEDDVLTTWSGLRPLIRQAGKAAKEMSRRDELWRDRRVITVAGGKLTGFRKMAQEAMDAVAEVLGHPVDPEVTLAPMGCALTQPFDAAVEQLVESHGISAYAARRVLRVYGSDAAAAIGGQPQPMADGFFLGEVDWAVDHEHARSLEDLIHRRLRIIPYRPQALPAVIDAAGRRMATRLGWSEERLARELEAARAHVRDGIAGDRVVAQAS